MGVHSICNMCSHLQNAARAKLAITSVPATKSNVGLAVAMHRAGLLSHVYRAGPTPPPLEAMETLDPQPATHATVAKQRLWLGIKYYNNKPVFSNMRAASSSKRLNTIDLPQLARVAHGLDANVAKSLNLGELLFVTTDIGVLEAREAIQRRRGGLMLVRVS
jgi:small subunit ribosomal protein S8